MQLVDQINCVANTQMYSPTPKTVKCEQTYLIGYVLIAQASCSCTTFTEAAPDETCACCYECTYLDGDISDELSLQVSSRIGIGKVFGLPCAYSQSI